MRFQVICLLFFLTTTAAADPMRVRSEPDLTTIQGDAFGTTYTIKLAMTPDESLHGRLQREITDAIARTDHQMSLWQESSELSRFNAAGGGEWFEVSAETAHVVRAALQTRDMTEGAFDPTVRPLLELWSFGPEQRPRKVPAEEDITAAMSLVGVPIEIRNEPVPGLRKPADGVQLDLNAIAKGYAVDEIARIVAGLTPQGFMVEVGGEVRTFGRKPDGTPWRIAIERPTVETRSIGWAISLEDAAMATSGDYRNYFEADGRRYSHTIDPRTGAPITHALASVSVVADDCMTADAWATALMVAGPDEGYNLAESHNIAACFLVRDGESFASRTTAGFPELISLATPMPDVTPWSTFLIAAVVFGIAIAGMAVGVILSNRRLRGSCGGLNGMTDSAGNSICDACTTPPEECDEVRKQLAAASGTRKSD